MCTLRPSALSFLSLGYFLLAVLLIFLCLAPGFCMPTHLIKATLLIDTVENQPIRIPIPFPITIAHLLSIIQSPSGHIPIPFRSHSAPLRSPIRSHADPMPIPIAAPSVHVPIPFRSHSAPDAVGHISQ